MNDNIAFALADTARMMRKKFDQAARELGITGPQWRLLFVIKREPGINQGALAERLEVEPITVCRMVDRLEQCGMVERQRDPRDRRAWRLLLKANAEPVLNDLRGLAEIMLDQAMTGFSADETAQLIGMLHRMRHNLSDETTSDDVNQIGVAHG